MKRELRCAIALLAPVMFLASLLFSAPLQTLSARPSFDVASVKPHDSSDKRSAVTTRGERFVATNYTLQRLVLLAYSGGSNPLFEQQLIGGPSWISKDAFDIEGRTGSAAISESQVRLMVQSLLEERFRLVLHHEMRDLPVYNLVVAKPGKLKASEDQTPPNPSSNPAASAGPPQGTYPRGRAAMWISASGIVLGGAAITLDSFANLLQQDVGRPIRNRTNLDGLFDIEMRILDRSSSRRNAQALDRAIPNAPDPSSGATVFSILQTDLGLRLDSARDAVDVFVVETVERPSSN